jgi:futalosine hydrolase
MLPALRQVLAGRALLLAVAADSEARAVAGALGKTDVAPPWSCTRVAADLELLVTGVGKANAAGAVARVLTAERHGAVLSVGVAGTYGQGRVGSVVVGTASAYADEGVRCPDRFIDLSELGFPPADLPGMSFPADPALLEAIGPLADQSGVIATVSACSGTDAQAREIRDRTGALAECMEGAAVAHVARRLGVPFCELRVISNTTGDRNRQVWDLKGSLGRLADIIGRLCG